MIVALALLASAEDYPIFLLAVIFWGIGSSLLNPGPLAYLAQLAPKSVLPIGVALYRTIGDAGAVLALLILGWLVETNNYNPALLVLMGLLFASVSSFAWFAPATKVKVE